LTEIPINTPPVGAFEFVGTVNSFWLAFMLPLYETTPEGMLVICTEAVDEGVWLRVTSTPIGAPALIVVHSICPTPIPAAYTVVTKVIIEIAVMIVRRVNKPCIVLKPLFRLHSLLGGFVFSPTTLHGSIIGIRYYREITRKKGFYEKYKNILKGVISLLVIGV
jgi:hypothetical protein